LKQALDFVRVVFQRWLAVIRADVVDQDVAAAQRL
jgi:hypothetical protein